MRLFRTVKIQAVLLSKTSNDAVNFSENHHSMRFVLPVECRRADSMIGSKVDLMMAASSEKLRGFGFVGNPARRYIGGKP